MESPAGSDDEGEMPYKKQRYSSKGKMGFSAQEREWREQGDKTLESGWAVMKRNDWCLEDTSSIGDTVQSLTLAGSRKAYRITGWINASPRKICEELFYNSEEIPKWNLSVRSCHVVEIVDEFTDIGHHVASDGGAGLIKTRDFVTLRRWAVKEGSYVIASSSVSHPQMPPLPNFVRGEILLSVMSLTASEGGEPGAVFSWALATDLKGWIPGKLWARFQTFEQEAKVSISGIGIIEKGRRETEKYITSGLDLHYISIAAL
ncbi:unnamed protein product [Darwinula stevensoni]|uniref:START domain-containing protein n=1 Tax=Darwinula stevensoni TaxID=69355 RepID=A0A7R9ACC5_9CRUS|nr:unnamed protein product [Darwinula stevensoni]CAG0900050.1 unnamed protein product [Darwinula stevensoni]